MGLIGWLLQWPVRALVLLLVAAMPLGVELAGFQAALTSAVAIGLLGTVLILPLKFDVIFFTFSERRPDAEVLKKQKKSGVQ